MKKHLFAILIASTLTLGGCSLVAPLSMIDNYKPSTPTSYSTSATPWWISTTTSTPWWISTSESTSTPWWVSTSESTSTPWWVSTSESTSTPWWVSTSESTYDPWGPTSEPTYDPWDPTSESSYDPWGTSESTYDPWAPTSESTYDPWASSESTSDSSSPSGDYYDISLDNKGDSSYPWTYDGYEYTSSNQDVHSSTSTMRISFYDSGYFYFDYMSYGESGFDYLIVERYDSYDNYVGTVLNCSSSSSPSFYSTDTYVEAGNYLLFIYSKDGSASYEDDCAKITNLNFSFYY